MRVIRFNDATKTMKLEPESFDDLYLLAMITVGGDRAGARSYRRFKPTEQDIGEQKEVYIEIEVEKAEIDKAAGRLRLTGKIESGKPEEFVRMGSYHTINVAPGDVIELRKEEWEGYILKRIKQAVEDAKKPKLGIIVMDDEKATAAYVRGYGIDIVAEIYSHLSKKMKEKEFEKQKVAYFGEIAGIISGLKVDTVIVAGPGFMKDNFREYAKDMDLGKKVAYAVASDAERSGIREVVQGEVAVKIMEGDHIRKEFDYLNKLFLGIRTGKASYGVEGVTEAMRESKAGVLLVNDSVLNDRKIKCVLADADRKGVEIEIFNSQDEAGMQLSSFKEIAFIENSLLQ